MKFPDFPRKGASVEESIENILRYLRSITIRSVQGGTFSTFPGGTDIKIDPPPMKLPPYDSKPNLFVSQPFNTGSVASPVWKVTVTQGFLTYLQLLKESDTTNGPLYSLTPTINDVSIENDPVPKLEITEVAGFVYLKVLTDNRGVPTEPPKILFHTTQKKSTHHVPPSTYPVYGSAWLPKSGIYYFLLAEIESDHRTTPAPRVKRRSPGDKFIPNQIDRIKNVGDKVEAYKRFDPENSTHEFKTFENIDAGRGEGILKDDEDSSTETSTVKFCPIDAKSDSPLQLTREGDVLIFGGNSYAGPTDGIVKNLTTRDGLVEYYETAESSLILNLINLRLTVSDGGTVFDLENTDEEPPRLYYRNGIWSDTDDGLGYTMIKNVVGGLALVVE